MDLALFLLGALCMAMGVWLLYWVRPLLVAVLAGSFCVLAGLFLCLTVQGPVLP